MKKPELRKWVQRLTGARKESQTALDEEMPRVFDEDGAADGGGEDARAVLDEQTLQGLLAEYNALRNQILKTQERRMQIISLTVGAFGVILSIIGSNVLGSSLEPANQLWVAIGGAITIYAIVIPSLIIMLTTQQSIEGLGAYIRIFIEPHVPGLSWERHLYDYRIQHGYWKVYGGMSIIYYFLSTLPLLLPIYALIQYIQGWFVALILIPFFIGSIELSYDLEHGLSRGKERERWKAYAKEHLPIDTYSLLPLESNQTPNHNTAPKQTDQP
jgi:hypothetical protein